MGIVVGTCSFIKETIFLFLTKSILIHLKRESPGDGLNGPLAKYASSEMAVGPVARVLLSPRRKILAQQYQLWCILKGHCQVVRSTKR